MQSRTKTFSTRREILQQLLAAGTVAAVSQIDLLARRCCEAAEPSESPAPAGNSQQKEGD